MGFLSRIAWDVYRNTQRQKEQQRKQQRQARLYPATTALAAIQKQERERKAREELARRGIVLPGASVPAKRRRRVRNGTWVKRI
jgi:hypothetical protein